MVREKNLQTLAIGCVGGSSAIPLCRLYPGPLANGNWGTRQAEAFGCNGESAARQE
jgi:hypothetical protein